ncbi:MAG: hypothetical protein JO121_21585 [Deltaproteobacteria bacterium]|nr:hypothetical protein [Deltaproteobacteria bacterium]
MGIKIQDVRTCGFSAPDLDAMEEFLAEFGMVRSERAGDRLYMRGLNGDPFLHITEVGAPGFLAAGFEAASVRDLETLGREVKTSIVASIPITCSAPAMSGYFPTICSHSITYLPCCGLGSGDRLSERRSPTLAEILSLS